MSTHGEPCDLLDRPLAGDCPQSSQSEKSLHARMPARRSPTPSAKRLSEPQHTGVSSPLLALVWWPGKPHLLDVCRAGADRLRFLRGLAASAVASGIHPPHAPSPIFPAQREPAQATDGSHPLHPASATPRDISCTPLCGPRLLERHALCMCERPPYACKPTHTRHIRSRMRRARKIPQLCAAALQSNYVLNLRAKLPRVRLSCLIPSWMCRWAATPSYTQSLKTARVLNLKGKTRPPSHLRRWLAESGAPLVSLLGPAGLS